MYRERMWGYRGYEVAEKAVERALVRAVRAAGGEAYKFTSPARRGVPDRLVIWPDGRVMFVELKRPGGTLSLLQQVEIARLRELGQVVYVIDSVEKVRRLYDQDS